MRRRWQQAATAAQVALLILPLAILGPSVRAEETGLERVKSLGALEIEALRQEGVTSLAGLAATDPGRLAAILEVEKGVASGIVVEANDELDRLQRAYLGARERLDMLEPEPDRLKGAEWEAYSALIAPTNECTILVRKVCGLENQCATHGGCATAKDILRHLNASENPRPAAESCAIALADDTVFPWCKP